MVQPSEKVSRGQAGRQAVGQAARQFFPHASCRARTSASAQQTVKTKEGADRKSSQTCDQRGWQPGLQLMPMTRHEHSSCSSRSPAIQASLQAQPQPLPCTCVHPRSRLRNPLFLASRHIGGLQQGRGLALQPDKAGQRTTKHSRHSTHGRCRDGMGSGLRGRHAPAGICLSEVAAPPMEKWWMCTKPEATASLPGLPMQCNTASQEQHPKKNQSVCLTCTNWEATASPA